MDELKPCPFCGNLPRRVLGDAWYWVACKCGAETGIRGSRHEAIELWNTRPTEAAATAAERARVLALVDDWAKSVPADDDDYVFIFRELRAAIESGEQPPEAH